MLWIVLVGVVAGITWSIWRLVQTPSADYFLQRRANAGTPAIIQQGVTANGGEAFELHTQNGLAVRLRIIGRATTPRPLILILGGQETGSRAVQLVGDPGEFTIAALDYPIEGGPIESARDAIERLPDLRQALLDTPPALSIALDWLVSQPWIDSRQIELIGVSAGVPFVAIAGALDPRFTRVWLIQGAADNRAWIKHAFGPEIQNRWLRSLAAASVYRLVYGDLFKTGEWVSRVAPRPVVIVGARADQRLPSTQIQSLYDAAREPKELLWIEGEHMSPYEPQTIRRVLEAVWSRLRAERRAAEK